MSHTIKAGFKFTNEAALKAAAKHQGWQLKDRGTHKLFDGTKRENAFALSIPGWRHDVILDVDRGEALYDNYGGRWGDEQQLHKFLQAYAVEKVKLEARRQGQTAIEQPLADGSIRVQIAVAG